MTVTHQDVAEGFGTTVNRDLLYMITGKVLGAGVFRIVYECEIRDDLVLKFEPNAQSFHNIAEWDFLCLILFLSIRQRIVIKSL